MIISQLWLATILLVKQDYVVEGFAGRTRCIPSVFEQIARGQMHRRNFGGLDILGDKIVAIDWFSYIYRDYHWYGKKCFFCGSANVVRNGVRGRTQRYKCKACGRRFDGGVRRDKTQVITDYVESKQTLEQLASKYGVNEKTIRREYWFLWFDIRFEIFVWNSNRIVFSTIRTVCRI